MSHAARIQVLAARGLVSLALFGCGPGEFHDPEPSDPKLDIGAGEDDGVVGDPWNCGELGLTCVGPLNIGSCIDGVCGPTVGYQCWSPQFAPTCDAYCEAFDRTCAYLGCAGATAYGWMGTPLEADYDCLIADLDTVVPMTITCEQPLAGIVTTVNCCCD